MNSVVIVLPYRIVSVVMKVIARGDPGYWMTAAGVCAIMAIAGA